MAKQKKEHTQLYQTLTLRNDMVAIGYYRSEPALIKYMENVKKDNEYIQEEKKTEIRIFKIPQWEEVHEFKISIT